MPEKANIARRPFLSSASSRRERSLPLPKPRGSNPKSPGARPEPLGGKRREGGRYMREREGGKGGEMEREEGGRGGGEKER